MTIEITRPEVEALIQQRLLTGAFASPEDVIFHALRSTEQERVSPPARKSDNLSDLLLDSPFAGSELNLERQQDYPRAVDVG